MFGARILSESAVNNFKQNLAYGVTVSDYDGQPGLEGSFVCKVYPDENVVIKSEKDSHGVATTTVKIVPEGTDSLGEVVLYRTIDGQEISVVLVSEHTFDSVYEGVPEADAERLPARQATCGC
jgi:hypothetical protein